MTAKLLDGLALSKKIRAEVTKVVKQRFHPPRLDVFLVGDDPASEIYVRNKQKACSECGIDSFINYFRNDTTTGELVKSVQAANEFRSCSGILVQLPLPAQIDRDEVLAAINPDKDVDGFNPINLGKLMSGKPNFVPCTPAGVCVLLDEYNIPLVGKHVVIVNDSIIVGKPLSMLLLQRGATVTLCNSHTENLKGITLTADVVVTAVGRRPETTGLGSFLLTADYIQPGICVIDVGINRVDGRVVGDVDKSVVERAGHLSPVPGGCGPMTISALLRNLVR